MKLYIAFSLLFFILFWQIQAQTLPEKQESNIFTFIKQNNGQQGTIIVNQSKEIENLVLAYIEYQRKESKLQGYRIRIFSASGSSARSKLYAEKDRFESLYPRYPVYIEYEAPNFKAYIGDFRNKLEAFKVYNIINKDFKNAFIVPAYINLPRID